MQNERVEKMAKLELKLNERDFDYAVRSTIIELLSLDNLAKFENDTTELLIGDGFVRVAVKGAKHKEGIKLYRCEFVDLENGEATKVEGLLDRLEFELNRELEERAK